LIYILDSQGSVTSVLGNWR